MGYRRPRRRPEPRPKRAPERGAGGGFLPRSPPKKWATELDILGLWKLMDFGVASRGRLWFLTMELGVCETQPHRLSSLIRFRTEFGFMLPQWRRKKRCAKWLTRVGGFGTCPAMSELGPSSLSDSFPFHRQKSDLFAGVQKDQPWVLSKPNIQNTQWVFIKNNPMN